MSSVQTIRRTRLKCISVQQCRRAVRDRNVNLSREQAAGQGSLLAVQLWPGLGGPSIKSAMISYTLSHSLALSVVSPPTFTSTLERRRGRCVLHKMRQQQDVNLELPIYSALIL